jgi:hypothetical protein
MNMSSGAISTGSFCAQPARIPPTRQSFGGVANVARTLASLPILAWRLSILKTRTFPKRCGHLDDKSPTPAKDMCRKIPIAREAAGVDCILIARTDAVAVEGLAADLERAAAYQAVGADIRRQRAWRSGPQSTSDQFFRSPCVVGTDFGYAARSELRAGRTRGPISPLY